MTFISRLSAGLTEWRNDVIADLKQVGSTLTTPKTSVGQIVDVLNNTWRTFIGEAVGVAELAGLRYPVSKYEFKLNDQFTRGSRIDDAEGYRKLVAQGFKSIVDLTAEGTRDASDGSAAGLKTLNVRILDNDAPTLEQMIQFLNFVTAQENQPVYVHCEAGKGRTGVAVACYRMAALGWSVDEAIAEARRFGCSQPDQLAFLASFGEQLQRGQIPGYPKAETLFS